MHALSNHMKEQTMTRYRRTAIGAIAALGLAMAASLVQAHSGGMGGGMGGGMHGDKSGMHGGKGGMHGGGHQMGGMHRHGAGGMGAGQQLMTPEERSALREKMRAANTPEERQALMASTRAEMEKRAKEKGITLPEQGARMGGEGHGQGGHRH
jgi:hypothetical protein